MEAWQSWMENYLRTFVERDVGRFGPAVSPIQMRRFVTMLAAQQSGLLNASDLGRALGVSYHTVQSYLEILEGHFLVRRLQPYYANIGKRLVKAPKLYIRDSGLLHYLLGISTDRQLLASPARGRSWEGYMVEQIEARERLERSGSQFFFYRTHTGTEVDLVIDRGQDRLGFEFKATASVEPRDWSNLQQARADGIVGHGFVVHMGNRSFAAADGVDVVAAAQLLSWERARAKA